MSLLHITLICLLQIPNREAIPWKAEPWLGPRIHMPTAARNNDIPPGSPVYKPGILPLSRDFPLVPIPVPKPVPETVNPAAGEEAKLSTTTTESSPTDDISLTTDFKHFGDNPSVARPLSVLIHKLKGSSKDSSKTNPSKKPLHNEHKRETNADDFRPSYRRRQTLTPDVTGGFVLDSLFPTPAGLANPFFGFPQNSFNVPYGLPRQDDFILQSRFLNGQLGGYPYGVPGLQYPIASPFIPQLGYGGFGGFGQPYPGANPFGGFGGYNPFFNPYQRLVTVPVQVVGQSLASVGPGVQNLGNTSFSTVDEFTPDVIPVIRQGTQPQSFVPSGFQTGTSIDRRPLGSSFAGANPFSTSVTTNSQSNPSVAEVAPFNDRNNNGPLNTHGQLPFGTGRDFSDLFKGPGHLNEGELFPFLRRPQPLKVEQPSEHGRETQEITDNSYEDQRAAEPMRPFKNPQVKPNGTVRGEPRSNESPKTKPSNTETTTPTHATISTATPTSPATAERRAKHTTGKSSKKTRSKSPDKIQPQIPATPLKKSPIPYTMGFFHPYESREKTDNPFPTHDVYPGVLRTPYLLDPKQDGRGPILHVGDPQLADQLRFLHDKLDNEKPRIPPVFNPPTICRGPHGPIPCDYLEPELLDVEGLKDFPGLGNGLQNNDANSIHLGRDVEFLRGGIFEPGATRGKFRNTRAHGQWRPLVYTRPKFRFPYRRFPV